MFPGKSIYRQVALERLAAPEQLDELMTVAPPRAWLAFGACALLLAAALAWGIFGRIPVRVAGHAVLVQPADPAEGNLAATVYVEASEGGRIRPGQTVQLQPVAYHKSQYGYLLAEVRAVGPAPVSRDALRSALGDDAAVARLFTAGLPVAVTAELLSAEDQPGRYRWSASSGPPGALHPGTWCTASIVVEERRPLALAIPALAQTAAP